jgi:hypothetical protein
VRELLHREAAQAAHDLQDVLIDGVDVEQVMLHLPDDASETGQIATEDTQLVHAPELLDQATLLLENLQKKRTVVRIVAEIIVDQFACSPQGALRARAHSLQFGMFLEQQKGFEDGAGGLLEHLLMDHVEKLVRILEAFVDSLRRLSGGGNKAAPMFCRTIALIWVTVLAVR